MSFDIADYSITACPVVYDDVDDSAYASQTRERLKQPRTVRLLTRLVLTMAWPPVGLGIMPVAKIAFATKREPGPVQRAGSLLCFPSISR